VLFVVSALLAAHIALPARAGTNAGAALPARGREELHERAVHL
jgi:hypothetical protein